MATPAHTSPEAGVLASGLVKSFNGPEGRVHAANPRSMVRPLAFSSASRSGSVPVSASTSVDLP